MLGRNHLIIFQSRNNVLTIWRFQLIVNSSKISDEDWKYFQREKENKSKQSEIDRERIRERKRIRTGGSYTNRDQRESCLKWLSFFWFFDYFSLPPKPLFRREKPAGNMELFGVCVRVYWRSIMQHGWVFFPRGIDEHYIAVHNTLLHFEPTLYKLGVARWQAEPANGEHAILFVVILAHMTMRMPKE